MDEIVSISSTDEWAPPKWALMERQLFDTLNQAAKEFMQKYVCTDGTLLWREDWPGMDGSDDPYEGFMYLALLYALGGDETLREESLRVWEGITWQWTEYGQVHQEFDKYYDWMHHGEGYLFFYFFGLANPLVVKNIQRAKKFAALYTGENEEIQNYDTQKQLIRSPLTGSLGPRHVVTEEDWITHRGILDDYLAPYEDISGVDFSSEKCPWSDDEVYRQIIHLMNERMVRGDVPLNLNATGLVTNAYLYTADEVQREWVLDYVNAWIERAHENGGIIPDNVGLSGVIGEYNSGKWWGGYYGWRWPHGFMTIIEPIINASMNAALISGDLKYLQFARDQLDRNWSLGREEDERWVTPTKHFDSGWSQYKVPNPLYPIYLWTMSMAQEDVDRVKRIAIPSYLLDIEVPTYSGRNPDTGKETKHYIGNTIPWFLYIRGEFPDYPERILEANFQLVAQQLRKMRSEEGNPETWVSDEFSLRDLSSIHKWQEMCPVYFEGLLQLTLGAPMHISHGGLQHGRVRYFDAKMQRPGLPNHVAALVEGLDADSVTLSLVNIGLLEEQKVIIQAGTFGEHQFKEALVLTKQGETRETIEVNGKWLLITLYPGSGIKLHVTMERYSNRPTYETPWGDPKNMRTIRGRSLC